MAFNVSFKITAFLDISYYVYQQIVIHLWVYYKRQKWLQVLVYLPHNEVVGGYIGFTPYVRPFVCLSMGLLHILCLFSNSYSSGWILSILGTNDDH